MTLLASLVALLFAAAPPAPVEGENPIDDLAGSLTGKWALTETLEPSDGHPQGATRQGDARWWVPPTKMPLHGEYRLAGEGGDEYETMTIWWDQGARQYRGVFCAAYNTQGCSSLTVERSGNQATIKGSYVSAHKTHRFLDVITFEADGTFTQSHAVAEPGGELKRISTIRGKPISRGR